jgi:hypothetical protein
MSIIHTTIKQDRRRRMGVAAALTFAAAVSVSGGIAQAAPTPDRLVQSTGNLYWTTNEATPRLVAARTATAVSGSQVSQYTYTATLDRASKSDLSPIALYTETSSTKTSFGALAYADVGTWYGYFVANYPSLGYSQIKRAPLAGGAAVTLATSPSMVDDRDLVTDGTSLFWTDRGGLRRMAIGGGTITALASGTDFSHLALDAGHVYYTSGSRVLEINKTGGVATVLGSSATTVTSLYVHVGSPSVAYWGGQDATMYHTTVGSGFVQTQQAPGGGVGTPLVSISEIGSGAMLYGWTSPYGSWVAEYGNSYFVSGGEAAGLHDLQGDPSRDMFWLDGTGVHSSVF